MENSNSVFTNHYPINSTIINTNKKLGLYGLICILQDAAGEHAIELGCGYEEMEEKGFFWVLTRQKLKMTKWPKWGNTIEIQTWSKPLDGIFAFREFEIFTENEKIGECTTSWMLLDSVNRKPQDTNILGNEINVRKSYSLNFISNKVIVPDEMTESKSFEVRISDLDVNNHVNNTKYSQWILDSIPFKYHKTKKLKEFEINFLVETFLDDIIKCYNYIKSISPENEQEVLFKGLRENDSKLVFTARILAQ